MSVHCPLFGLGILEIPAIALMIAELNDLEVKSTDILNPYVQEAVTEKVLGVEFGGGADKTAGLLEHCMA